VVLRAVGLRRGGRKRPFLVVYIVGIWVVRLRGRLDGIMSALCPASRRLCKSSYSVVVLGFGVIIVVLSLRR
jgi:hypothetical protein